MDTNFLGLSHLLYPFSGGEQMKLPHNWAKVWFDPFEVVSRRFVRWNTEMNRHSAFSYYILTDHISSLEEVVALIL